MHERPTDNDSSKAAQEVHRQSKAGDSERMGFNGKRGRGVPAQWDSSLNSVPLEEAIGTRGGGISQGNPNQTEPPSQRVAEGESEPQGYCDPAVTGTDALEKKDELGLTGRKPGQSYSEEQRQRIVDAVRETNSKGVAIINILSGLKVPRSTFYSWKSHTANKTRPTSSNALLDSETNSVISMKEKQTHLCHRQISGLLRHENVWVSPSSCYRILKSEGLIWEWILRDAPWKTAHYEPFRPNQIWGEDWSSIVIDGLRHYLLTILDLFSRYLVAWGIVKTVTKTEIKNLVALAIMSQRIDESDLKPILRTDPGSPNMAADVRIFLRDVGVVFSPGRVARPTDNARQERFYRTLKQEEVYCHDGYVSLDSARTSIGYYIDYYNETRPHQSLFGYPPAVVHSCGNKTRLLEQYRHNVENAKQKRRQERLLNNQKLTTFSS